MVLITENPSDISNSNKTQLLNIDNPEISNELKGITSSSQYLDEGELESEQSDDGVDTSSEGEIESDFELEPNEPSPKRAETPWERGLRLARERLERAKELKASEKDLEQKRMTMMVPIPVIETPEVENHSMCHYWQCYYQAHIIGRTELTAHRLLSEDNSPPTEAEVAAWRRSVENYPGREHRQRRRRSSASYSSLSSDENEDEESDTSSLASVALSWKLTCAKALKTHLRSPVRGRRRHSSASSIGSRSDSSRSRSLSNDNNRPVRRRREMMDQSPDRYRRRQRSNSNSSEGSGDDNQQALSRRGKRQFSQSPTAPRRRSDVPLLPNEKPVKRPWAPAPNRSTAMSHSIDKVKDRRSRSDSSNSDTRSQPGGREEKRFITSWSRSPSPDNRSRTRPQDIVGRRNRLPDVVPGGARQSRQLQYHHQNEQSQPIRRKQPPGDRSPFLTTTQPNNNQDVGGDQYRYQQRVTKQPTDSRSDFAPPSRQQQRADVDDEQGRQSATHHQHTLPPNRPGVRLTLAPRIKPTGINMAAMAAASGGGRPDRHFRDEDESPTRPSRPLLPMPAPSPPQSADGDKSAVDRRPDSPSTDLVRAQAEAVAARVEERARRRAQAEAEKRRRNPDYYKRQREEQMAKIPLRGRPTYRRMSFSSDDEDGSGSAVSDDISPVDNRRLLPGRGGQRPQFDHRQPQYHHPRGAGGRGAGYAGRRPNNNRDYQYGQDLPFVGRDDRRGDLRQSGPFNDYQRRYPPPSDSVGGYGQMTFNRPNRTPHYTADGVSSRSIASKRSPHGGRSPPTRHVRRNDYDANDDEGFAVVNKRQRLDDSRSSSTRRNRPPASDRRAEPFESDAAEQRLRELRERLNLVDDAIAEIKAGSKGGGSTGGSSKMVDPMRR